MTQDKLVADAEWELQFVEGSLKAIADLCNGGSNNATVDVDASSLGCLMKTIAFRVKHARGFLERYDLGTAESERAAQSGDRNEREAAVHAAVDKRVDEFVAAAAPVTSPAA